MHNTAAVSRNVHGRICYSLFLTVLTRQLTRQPQMVNLSMLSFSSAASNLNNLLFNSAPASNPTKFNAAAAQQIIGQFGMLRVCNIACFFMTAFWSGNCFSLSASSYYVTTSCLPLYVFASLPQAAFEERK